MLGYDSAWLGESIVARPCFDPLITLAAIAVKTDRIGLGIAVLVATPHHPVCLAVAGGAGHLRCNLLSRTRCRNRSEAGAGRGPRSAGGQGPPRP
ncbi:LLM class flavin-dependent oxidoreductase [Nocardia rhamnosiphila]|uniref:LLM class flavin-dependent oxidoreductase n=1 Tax=Nocardia rhamnosiphila TaxID=426716 RepID=A0ABV2X295_9NOCA